MSTALLTPTSCQIDCAPSIGDSACGTASSVETVICRCLKVTESDVQLAISTYNITTVRELGRCTGAGKGCMSCHGRLKAIIADRNS